MIMAFNRVDYETPDLVPHRPGHTWKQQDLAAKDYAMAVALSVFEHLFDRKDAPEFIHRRAS